ncbi:unnamed protein product [Nezara viridula]|uniref:Uncharacterized protein n=1 Tax=Nezara viridula TaxID=85310 RepID=A0A9P0E2R4_NEZVI|nr:unnamed protein product [Nezara viridula]
MLTLCVYIFILVFIAIHFIFKFIVKIRLGTPPIGSLIIAYKYSPKGLFKNLNFFRKDVFSSSLFSSMRFYYTDQLAKEIEYADGVILSDTGVFPNDHLLFLAKQNGFSIIKTPAISHAIYVTFPIFLSLTITKIFAIFVGYPTIRQFSEERNLCGYPVLEVYSKHSVMLIVPLLRQDEFVVQEAENIVYGREFLSVYNFHNKKQLSNLDLCSNQHSMILDMKNLKGSKLTKRETKG